MVIREVKGTCPQCGREIVRRSPVPVVVVCDCYKKCPMCGEEMTTYTPVLTPSTYGPIEGDTALGDTEHPINILYQCSKCGYLSAQKPVEVLLE